MCVLWQAWSTHRIFFYWIPAHINIWVKEDCHLFKKEESDVLIIYWHLLYQVVIHIRLGENKHQQHYICACKDKALVLVKKN